MSAESAKDIQEVRTEILTLFNKLIDEHVEGVSPREFLAQVISSDEGIKAKQVQESLRSLIETGQISVGKKLKLQKPQTHNVGE